MYEAPSNPQPLGGVLDSGFRLFKESFNDTWLLAGTGGLLSALIERPAESVASGDGSAALGLAIAGLIGLIAMIVVYGALIARIDAVARGTALPLDESLTRGLSRTPALIGAGIVYGVAVAVGMALLVIPGIFLLVALAFAVYTVVTDDMGPLESIYFSYRIVRGNWFRTAGLIIISALIMMVVFIVIGIVAGILFFVEAGIMGESDPLSGYSTVVVATVISAVAYPLVYSIFMATLNDLKLRHRLLEDTARLEQPQP